MSCEELSYFAARFPEILLVLTVTLIVVCCIGYAIRGRR